MPDLDDTVYNFHVRATRQLKPVLSSCAALNDHVQRTRRLPKSARYLSYCRVVIPLTTALSMLAPDTVKPNAVRRSP